MDFGLPVQNNRRARFRSASLGKSSSEPDLSGCLFSEHYTPRFADNLKKLIHEFVSVDDLKFCRKKKSAGFSNEIKSNFELYDKESPVVPFSALKTEYKKEFGRSYSVRSRSVPKKIGHLNETTSELIEALRDDDSDVITIRSKREIGKRRSSTARIAGDIAVKADDALASSKMKPYARVREPDDAVKAKPTESRETDARSCTLKVEGELTYSPEYRDEYHSRPPMERSRSIPQMGHIKFQGSFHGVPEYKESFPSYDRPEKSESLKRKDTLNIGSRSNAAVILPFRNTISSEYGDRFKDKSVRHSAKTKPFKQFDNFTLKNDLIVGHQHTLPLYRESFRTPPAREPTSKATGRDSTLALEGKMQYSPEYRSSYVGFPRVRPTTKKADDSINLFEAPVSSPSLSTPPLKAPILRSKYAGRVAVVEPSKNVHHPTGLDANPFFLCQPEVRKARREILIRERPPSPHKTLAAAIRTAGPIPPVDEDEENKIFREKSRIITSASPKTIHVTVENVDEPRTKPETILTVKNSPKYGRRASAAKPPARDMKANAAKMRNQSKIVEGNRDYNKKLNKKNSITSTTTDDEGKSNSNDETTPSFVVLKDPCNQSKWMKSSWYI